MQIIRKNIVLFLLLTGIGSRAQNPDVIRQYIDTYKDLAIQEMLRTGIPASIKLAQGIHETQAGTSELVLSSNNHFGIKCKSNWRGESVKHDDDARAECFRKYPSASDSYRDHSDFLANSPRYAFLFALDPSDYAAWAKGLKKAGYATNPHYPQVLIKLVEDYNLQQYTLMALGKKQDRRDDGYTAMEDELKPVEAIAGKAEVVKHYPEGEFSINDTKVVFVKAGTSFSALAKQYGIDQSRIFEFNEIPPTEEAGKDQLIYLQRKRKTGDNEFHIVQPGESLQEIAQVEAIRLESLQQLNWLKGDEQPAVGEKLSLRTASSFIPKLAQKENYSIIRDNKPKSSN